MQKVYLRKPKVATEVPTQDNEKILHFSLQNSLPEGRALALNKLFGTLSYLACDERGMPRLERQEQFTNTEMGVLLPLLEMFPYYCPYEVLYAGFYAGGKTTEENIAEAHDHLEDAEVEGTWEQEMRAVRCALSRTRLKIRSFGIDISSILATGYILMIANEPAEERRTVERKPEQIVSAPRWRESVV